MRVAPGTPAESIASEGDSRKNGLPKPQSNRNALSGAIAVSAGHSDAAATPIKGPWFDVPARSTPSDCRSCGAEVYWIRTFSGARMPVDVEVDGGRSPFVGVPGDGELDGRGISHFATCPQAGQWRQK